MARPDVFESLDALGGQAGDDARQAASEAPMPYETPGMTQSRVASQNNQTRQYGRIKAGDLSQRGVAYTMDARGNAKEVTDSTGAPLTNADKSAKIAYDSTGKPVDYSSPSNVRDAYADVPVTTDKKTGNQYQIHPSGRLPWQYVGHDEQVASQVQQQQTQQLNAKTATALAGPVADAGAQATAAKKAAKASYNATLQQLQAAGVTADPNGDPATVRAQVESSFNDQYAAKDANEKPWFGGGKLSPAAEARRKQIDLTKQQTLDALDAHQGVMQQHQQAQADLADLTQQRSSLRGDRLAEINQQRIAAGLQPVGTKSDRLAAAQPQQEEAPADVVQANDKAAEAVDATPEKANEVFSQPEIQKAHAVAVANMEQAKAGQKPYGADDNGNVLFDAEKPYDSLKAAVDDGLIDREWAADHGLKFKAAQEKAQEIIKSAGNYSEAKALLHGAGMGGVFMAGAIPGASAGAALGIESGPGALVTGAIGGLATGSLAVWGARKGLAKLGEYSEAVKSLNDAAELHPALDAAGQLVAFGSGAPKAISNLIRLGKIANATGGGIAAAKAIGLQVGAGAAGGLAFEGAVRPVFDTAVDFAADKLGIDHEEMQAPTVKSLLTNAALGMLLQGKDIAFRDVSVNDAASILFRDKVRSVAGLAPDAPMTAPEVVDAMKKAGVDIDPAKADDLTRPLSEAESHFAQVANDKLAQMKAAGVPGVEFQGGEQATSKSTGKPLASSADIASTGEAPGEPAQLPAPSGGPANAPQTPPEPAPEPSPVEAPPQPVPGQPEPQAAATAPEAVTAELAQRQQELAELPKNAPPFQRDLLKARIRELEATAGQPVAPQGESAAEQPIESAPETPVVPAEPAPASEVQTAQPETPAGEPSPVAPESGSSGPVGEPGTPEPPLPSQIAPAPTAESLAETGSSSEAAKSAPVVQAKTPKPSPTAPAPAAAEKASEPMRIIGFHGTTEPKPIEKFDLSKTGVDKDVIDAKLGFFFARDSRGAYFGRYKGHTGQVGSIGRYEINLQKPYHSDHILAFDTLKDFPGLSVAQVREKLISQGYDGIVTKGNGEVVVFHPDNVKLSPDTRTMEQKMKDARAEWDKEHAAPATRTMTDAQLREAFPTSEKSQFEETGILSQVAGVRAGTDGFWSVIPPSAEDIADGWGPTTHGPWETEEEAQRFNDNEVSTPEVRIVEVRNGKPVSNPFRTEKTISAPAPAAALSPTSQPAAGSGPKSVTHALETVKTDIGKALKLPDNARALQATDSKGRQQILTVKNGDFKGSNPFHGEKWKSVVAGNVDSKGKFQPVKGKVELVAPKTETAAASDSQTPQSSHAEIQGPKTPIQGEAPSAEIDPKENAAQEHVTKLANAALALHHGELDALGHPREFEIGTTKAASGIETDVASQRIRVDPAQLAKATEGMTPAKGAEFVKKAVAEEVIHVGTLKYAEESPENREKLMALTGDNDLMARAKEAYGPEWDQQSDFAKAAEAARMLIQGPEELTESSYRFLKDFLDWLKTKLANLSKDAREVIKGIEEKLGRYSKTAEATKEQAPPEKRGSTQVTLSEDDAKPLRDFVNSIPESELYSEKKPDGSDKYGRELESHVTALYGLTGAGDTAKAVKAAVKEFGPVTLKLGKITSFENEGSPYDVLKVDVDSPDLHKLNAALKKLPFKSDFPDYHPHLTLAYVKKGEAAKYVGDDRFEGKEITIDNLTHSSAEREKTKIPLAGTPEEKPATPNDIRGEIERLKSDGDPEKLVPGLEKVLARMEKPAKVEAPAEAAKSYADKLADNELAEAGDEVTWKAGDGRQAVATVTKVLPDGRAIVDWFGTKYVPVSDLTIKKKSTARENREAREQKVKAPVQAAKEVQRQITKAKTGENPRSAKEIKTELIQRLKEAITKAGDESELTEDQRKKMEAVRDYNEGSTYKMGYAKDAAKEAEKLGVPKIEIHVPGDGSIKVWNTKQVLSDVLRRVEKMPTSQRESKPGTPTAISKEEPARLADLAADHFGRDGAIDWLRENSKGATPTEKKINEAAIAILSNRTPSEQQAIDIENAKFEAMKNQRAKESIADEFYPEFRKSGYALNKGGATNWINQEKMFNGDVGALADKLISMLDAERAKVKKPVTPQVSSKPLSAATPGTPTPEGEGAASTPPPSGSPQGLPSSGDALPTESLSVEARNEKLMEEAEAAGLAPSLETIKALIRGDEAAANKLRQMIKDRTGSESINAATPEPTPADERRLKALTTIASKRTLRPEEQQEFDALKAARPEPEFHHSEFQPREEDGSFKERETLGAANPFGSLVKQIKDHIRASGINDAIKFRHDAVENIADYHGSHASNSIELDYPDEKDINAAPFVIEGGRDPLKLAAHLQSERQKIATSADPKLAKKWLPVIDHAIAKQTEIAAKRTNHDKLMGQSHAELKAAGFDVGTVEDYVRRVLSPPETVQDAMEHPLFPMGGGAGGSPKGITKGRVFETLGDAIHAGYQPETSDLATLDHDRIAAGKKLLERKALVESFKGIMSPTTHLPIIGKMESVKKLNGETEMQIPRGYQGVQIGGQMQVVDNQHAPLFRALNSPSAIRQSPVGRFLIKLAAFAKHGTLVFDTFHGGRLAYKMVTSGGGHDIGRGVAAMRFSDADIPRAIAAGEITAEDGRWAVDNRTIIEQALRSGANLGRVADNLWDQSKASNIPIIKQLKGFNAFLFKKLAPAAMTQAYVANYHRNMRRAGMTPAEAARQTSKEMNAQFGNLRSQGIFQSKTAQDIANLFALAPNWTVSQFINELRAYAQLPRFVKGVVTGKGFSQGNAARALIGGALALFAINQLINFITRGKPTWENEEGHKLDAWFPGGKRGFFFNPFEIAGEYAHAAFKYAAQNQNAVDIAAHILSNKMSPLARGAMEAMTGRDAQGRHFLSDADRARASITDALPMPIGLNAVLEKDPRTSTGYRLSRAPGAIEKQLLQSAGMKVTAAQSPRTLMFAAAQPYRPDRGGSDTAGEYTELRRALDNNDTASARTEVQWLQNRGKPLYAIAEAMGIRKDGTIKPEQFAGGEAREEEMLKHLTPEQKKVYAQAQAEHLKNAVRFMQLYPGAAQQPRPSKPSRKPFAFY